MDFQVGDIVTVKPRVFQQDDPVFRAEVLAVNAVTRYISLKVISVGISKVYGYYPGLTLDFIPEEFIELVYCSVEQKQQIAPTVHYCPRCTYTEVSSSAELCKWCK